MWYILTDPIEVLEQKQAMISNHRAEMSELENTIDKEQAEQLSELREQVATQTKQTLDEKKDKTIGNLKAQGKWNYLKIYDVSMKFARKLIHGGPVHPCWGPMEATAVHGSI